MKKEKNGLLREETARQARDFALNLETKEYLTLDEAAKYIGMKRATIYNYMKDLKIKTQRFGRDRRSYLTLADVKRMKEYKEKPWTGEDDTAPRRVVKEQQS